MNPNIKERIIAIGKKLSIQKPWDSIIIFVISLLITIPLFIIIHQNIIEFGWIMNLDRIILFILVLAVLFFILRLFRRIIIITIIVYFCALFYGTIIGDYGFYQVYDDYKVIIFAMSENPNPQDVIVSKLLPFPNKNKIIKAVEFNHSDVRNFALMSTTKHFKDIKGYQKYRQVIQCFAIFKEIQSRWNYVNDPKGREYIAVASESLQHFSGDCDDHAILMAACVRAVGGTPRLIHTQAHIYPEMLIGSKSDLETVIYLIKEVLFVKESKGKAIHYHIDERGQIWLNLDYTAKYPGGPFMSKEILGELTLN
ncbi:MAG: transglutaminase domain-containing protein [Bacteroidota bacterium]|nr:transglutaminase domain-containing protein [Bacteroidota bacterium]